MKRVPDRLFLNYPDDRLVLDTGWRGETNNIQLYPGRISGIGQGQMSDLFKKSD